MTRTVSKLKTVVLIAGAALIVVACGDKKDEAPATESSIAEPHASLSAAADVMSSPPADSAAATPPAEQK